MPLTSYQADLLKIATSNRRPDSYLAGGAALHLLPTSIRYSNDLDFFHDSVERVAQAFAEDREAFVDRGHRVTVDMAQPGYIRALVERDGQATKIEWAHDSAWRFLPCVFLEDIGFVLHPMDLSVNKLLALVGRDEPRDFLDVLHLHRAVLPLGAMCWAAAGKDPGFSPSSLLELLRRRGKYRPEDFARLHLAQVVDLPSLKASWLEALEKAQAFIASRPPQDLGCLYYSLSRKVFVEPTGLEPAGEVAPHFGRPGGVLPRILED